MLLPSSGGTVWTCTFAPNIVAKEIHLNVFFAVNIAVWNTIKTCKWEMVANMLEF